MSEELIKSDGESIPVRAHWVVTKAFNLKSAWAQG